MGLAHLADASTEGLRPFGTDVFSNPECTTGLPGGPGAGGGGAGGGSGATGPATHLKITPRKVKVGTLQIFHLSLTSGTVSCREAAIIHFAGHKTHTSRKGKARIKARLSASRQIHRRRPPDGLQARQGHRPRPLSDRAYAPRCQRPHRGETKDPSAWLTLRQELGNAWTLRFGPLGAECRVSAAEAVASSGDEDWKPSSRLRSNAR